MQKLGRLTHKYTLTAAGQVGLDELANFTDKSHRI